MKENDSITELAILVGVHSKGMTTDNLEEYLDELKFLAETAGAVTDKIFTQKMEYPDPKFFVGSGKLNEIIKYSKEKKIDLIIFDDELTASQQRNIEKAFEREVKILDRSHLILDIFARRAQTAQAKTQVELAQNQYLLPRLTNLWTHLSKQKGGIGMKGPGEKEIETDRRVIRDRITLLKEKLKDIDKQNFTQRKSRERMIRLALVGYTNVGKSTIMNLLSKADVFAENKLFATVDSTVRKVVFDRVPFLLSDTVGFIRKLPHHLIESFKSTLEEVREADLLLHVVDISHQNFEDHMEVVHKTLVDINVLDKPEFIIFNMIDKLKVVPDDLPDYEIVHEEKKTFTLEELKTTWMAKKPNSIFISAKEKVNIDELRLLISEKVKTLWAEKYPHDYDFI